MIKRLSEYIPRRKHSQNKLDEAECKMMMGESKYDETTAIDGEDTLVWFMQQDSGTAEIYGSHQKRRTKSYAA